MGDQDRHLPSTDGTELLAPSPFVRGTCADCYTWNGSRGSAHDPANCPHRSHAIERARRDVIAARQRLADLTGVPS